MKINQGMRVGRESISLNRERASMDSVTFQKMMKDQQNKLDTDQLQKLLGDIEKQGERLDKHRTVEELRTYKELVRKFVQEAVSHGVGLEEQSSFPFRGRERRMKLLKEIDGQLMSLTNDILQQQEKTIDILARVGEMKGLLLNLYL